jgi:hypothetical protein
MVSAGGEPDQESGEPTTTSAEGGLVTEANTIESQARLSRRMEGENLLTQDGHEHADSAAPAE